MLLVKVLRNRTQVPFLNLTASGIYKKRTWVVFQAFHLGLQIWGVHSKPKVSYVHSGSTQCRQNRTWVYFRKPTAYAFFTAPGTRVYLPKPAAAQNQEKKGPGLLLVQFVRTPPVLFILCTYLLENDGGTHSNSSTTSPLLSSAVRSSNVTAIVVEY